MNDSRDLFGTAPSDRPVVDRKPHLRDPPDGEGLKHQALVMPVNSRSRRPARLTAGQLKSTPWRGTVPAWSASPGVAPVAGERIE